MEKSLQKIQSNFRNKKLRAIEKLFCIHLPIKESEINFKVTSKDRSDINENFIQRSTLFLVGEIHF